jgi:glutathione peroxidase
MPARILLSAVLAALPGLAAAACPTLLDQKPNTLQGKPDNLCRFEGQVVVVVNTASYCGYTKQYEGLETLYQKYKDKGLVVLGFPSNDFGKQEPGTNAEVADFCERTFKVRFPMYEKSVVAGPGATALYRQLAAKTGEAPKWNFHKYVIDRKGEPVASFPSKVTPQDPQLVAAVEKALAAR